MPGSRAEVPAAARATYPRRPGNALRPWVDGAQGFERIGAALEEAKHSVHVCVSSLEREFAPPGGRGSLLDWLERAAARGLEVHLLCCRESPQNLRADSPHFVGDSADRAFLRDRNSALRIRWDRPAEGFCQHQKYWLLDAGEAGECAFVGDLDPTARSLGGPAASAGPSHGLLLELAGPAVSDLHHNFVQRWNEASEREAEDGGWPAAGAPLALPSFLSPARGEIAVQITRTVRSGAYSDESPPPGAKPYPIAQGEQSALEHYVSAIAAAERSLYFESRAIASPIVVDELRRALVRGVRVAFLVPGQAHPDFVEARRDPRSAPFFEQLSALGSHENFTLAALCASREDGRYQEIDISAALLIADDRWASLGSTAIAVRSLRQDTTSNASFWSPEHARALREARFEIALGAPLGGLEPSAAFDRFRELALRNLDRRPLWEALEGRVYAIDPAHYGA